LKRNLGEGYLIEVAESGEEALEIFAESVREGFSIPVIISDQIMPGMKGDDLLIQIHHHYPETLKILLTGQASADDVGKAVNFGNLYRFIAKPWDELDLCLTVKEALRRYLQDEELITKNQELEKLNASLEEKVRERSAELEKRNHLLERKNQEIENLNLLKDQLISTVSHDLKNPIGVIIGMTKLLLSRESLSSNPEKLRSLLESIQCNAERMLHLVNDLLDLSKIEQGMPLQIQPINLMTLLQQQIDSFALLSEQKSIDLQFFPPPDDLLLPADPSRLEQVVSNLLSNAIKYTPQGGDVILMVVIEADHVTIQIKDTGLGIPAEDLSHIFDKFYRVNTSEHRVVQGTGLGLSIVKAIVEQHGGRIGVESTLGEGSLFSLAFPRSQPEGITAAFLS
jgi:signal transduction histidine kinase